MPTREQLVPMEPLSSPTYPILATNTPLFWPVSRSGPLAARVIADSGEVVG